ncbi:hypothetical protein AAG906_000777 [Vitis piasezkii]
MEWVALVDNLEAFNKYPWGGICYERTLFGLQRALENRVSKYQDKKKTKGEAAVEAYSLVGFPYAFQEQQQDYYKHVDKQGASAEMLHQSNASQDAKKDDLRHEKSSSDTAAYVAAATAAMAEETTNDAVTPSIEKLWMEFVKLRQSSS